MKNNLTIYKANDLVESTYTLTLNEQRILLACIGQINSNQQLSINDKFELSAKDFAGVFDLDERGAYDELINVARQLKDRKLFIQNPISGADCIEMNWVSAIEYTKSTGIVGIWFAQPLLPYLAGFKEKFTRYKLENVSGMTSIYGVRLYELLAQYRNIGKREFSIEWLKQHFEIENSYSDLSNFKKRVIDAAINDIKKHSNLAVTHTYKKTGRNVTHIIFEFKERQIKAKKATSKTNPIDSVDHYADMIKRFGKDGDFVKTIPPEIVETLKQRGIL